MSEGTQSLFATLPSIRRRLESGATTLTTEEALALVSECERLQKKVSDDRVERWSMQRHLDAAKASLARYEKEIGHG